jgi:threonyl-tRNA synthetase
MCSDDRDHTLSARVREAWRLRVPYVAIVGGREAADGSLSVRVRDGRQLGPLQLTALVDAVAHATALRLPEPE